MPYFVLLVSILAGIGVWWWRLKNAAEAGSQIIDGAERLHGAYRRKKFRDKADRSPLFAVDDPTIAATAMMYAVATLKGPPGQTVEDGIARELTEIIGVKKPHEAMIHAKWISDQQIDPNNMSRVFSRLWLDRLTAAECLEVAKMAGRIARIDGPPTALQEDTLARLCERLQLPRGSASID